MGKILERHKLPTLIQDKVDSPNRSTRDWASDQKTFNKQKFRTFTDDFYQMFKKN